MISQSFMTMSTKFFPMPNFGLKYFDFSDLFHIFCQYSDINRNFDCKDAKHDH